MNDAISSTPTSSRPPPPPRSVARWVAAVVAVSSGAATVYGLYTDKRIAVLAFLGMVFAMVLLLVVQRAVTEVGRADAKFYDLLVKVLVVFVVLYFMVLTSFLFPQLVWWLAPTTTSGVMPERKPLSPEQMHLAIAAGFFGVHMSVSREKNDGYTTKLAEENLIKACTLLQLPPDTYRAYVTADNVPIPALRMFVTSLLRQEVALRYGEKAGWCVEVGKNLALVQGLLVTATQPSDDYERRECFKTITRIIGELEGAAKQAGLPKDVSVTLQRALVALRTGSTSQALDQAEALIAPLLESMLVSDLAGVYLKQ